MKLDLSEGYAYIRPCAILRTVYAYTHAWGGFINAWTVSRETIIAAMSSDIVTDVFSSVRVTR